MRASPRPRGWTVRWLIRDGNAYGFPAPAGMDPRSRASAASRTWLPRARGDGPEADGAGQELPEASPRLRGWTRQDGDGRRDPPGFPAPAGMDPHPVHVRFEQLGLPRARGDGPHAAKS